MSYILEALKKAELQRELGQVPGIDSEHEKPRPRASMKWVWAGVAVLTLNVGLMMAMLWPKSGPDDGIAGGQLAAPPPPLAQAPQPTAPAGPAVPPEPLPAPVPAPVQPQPGPQTQPVPPPAPVAAVPPAQPVPVSPPPAPPQPAAAVVATAPAVTPGTVIQQPVAEPSPPPVPQPAEPAPPAVTGYEALPLWPQIPPHLFRQLNGGIRLDVHVYSPQPQDRFVLINLQKYHEGEQLQEGPQLDAITPEGVVLSFQGQQFRVSAQ